MQENSPFLIDLQALLARTPVISKWDVRSAAQMVADRHRQTTLRSSGRCVACDTTEIHYPRFSSVHIARGDEWLDGTLRKRMKRWPPKLKKESGGWREIPSVNGYRFEHIEPYICESCRNAIFDLIPLCEEDEQLKRLADAEYQVQRERMLLTGETPGSPMQVFYALCNRMTPADVNALQQMPYHDFLRTLYWNTVRRYVLLLHDFECVLCSSTECLNVHHKTYEHRGREFQFLDDLTVLCRLCHEKFHDVVASPRL